MSISNSFFIGIQLFYNTALVLLYGEVNQLLYMYGGAGGSVTQSCPTLHGLESTRLLCAWGSPGKSTGVGCHFLLQGIFPTQELNLGLLHCRQFLYRLSYQGSAYTCIKFTFNYIYTYNLEKQMATDSNSLAWTTPRIEESGGLQSMGSQRIGHSLVTEQ